MKPNKFIFLAAISTAMAMLVASCGTKKAIADNSSSAVSVVNGNGQHTSTDKQQVTVKNGNSGSSSLEQMNFLRKVADNAVYSSNIVSKIKLTINNGSNDLSLGGTLHMCRDEVIRIQITPFGIMEAARLEFTKDYVLLIDRIHKEYVKASYSDVDFLQRNGLDFYTLQAIFWNQLFVPGMQKISDSSLKNFSVQLSNSPSTNVMLKHGKMNYVWKTDSKTGFINSLNAQYSGSTADAASVNCSYASFKQLGTKSFPTDISLTMSTKTIKNASRMSLRLQLNTLTQESGWELKTAVSSKYKQVSVQELLGKLGGM